ncbi:hypothetical protein RCL1_008549 [Eukaryota sp. TZLM3-RCL]
MFSPRRLRNYSPSKVLSIASPLKSCLQKTPILNSPRSSPFKVKSNFFKQQHLSFSPNTSSQSSIEAALVSLIKSKKSAMTLDEVVSDFEQQGFQFKTSEIEYSLNQVSSRVLYEKPLLKVPGFPSSISGTEDPLLTTMYLFLEQPIRNQTISCDDKKTCVIM